MYTFKLHMVTDQTNPYEPFAPRVRKSVQMLWHHKCFDKEPDKTSEAPESNLKPIPEAHDSVLQPPKNAEISISRTQPQTLPIQEESKISEIRKKIGQYRQQNNF